MLTWPLAWSFSVARPMAARNSSSVNASPRPSRACRAEIAGEAQLLQFPREKGLLERRVRHVGGLEAVTGGRGDRDRAAGVQVARAKRDRRDVSLARRPQAQDESKRARRQIRLVGVRHDRGVEERRGFERVLVREVGAEKQAPFVGDGLVRAQPGPNLVEPSPQEIPDLHVPLPELHLDLRQQRPDFRLGKRHDLGTDRADAFPARGPERPREHPGAVRMKDEIAAGDGDGDGLHGISGAIGPARRRPLRRFASSAFPRARAGTPAWIRRPDSH